MFAEELPSKLNRINFISGIFETRDWSEEEQVSFRYLDIQIYISVHIYKMTDFRK